MTIDKPQTASSAKAAQASRMSETNWNSLPCLNPTTLSIKRDLTDLGRYFALRDQVEKVMKDKGEHYSSNAAREAEIIHRIGVIKPNGIYNAAYSLFKEKLLDAQTKGATFGVHFNDEFKQVTFDHFEKEVRAIFEAFFTSEEITYLFDQNLNLLTNSNSLSNRMSSGAFEVERPVALKESTQALLEQAHEFLQTRSPAPIALSPPAAGTTPADYFVDVFKKHKGLCLAEPGGINLSSPGRQSASKRVLIENLERLKSEGLSVIYLEHLCLDSMQPLINAYFASNQTDPPEPLKCYLEDLDRGQSIGEPEFGFHALVKAAKRADVLVVGIDTSLSYNLAGKERLIGMNSTATAIIEHDQNTRPGKYIALMGNGHVGTVTTVGEERGPPGVAELLQIPSIQISKGSPSIAVNLKDFRVGQECISHLGAVLTVPATAPAAATLPGTSLPFSNPMTVGLKLDYRLYFALIDEIEKAMTGESFPSEEAKKAELERRVGKVKPKAEDLSAYFHVKQRLEQKLSDGVLLNLKFNDELGQIIFNHFEREVHAILEAFFSPDECFRLFGGQIERYFINGTDPMMDRRPLGLFEVEPSGVKQSMQTLNEESLKFFKTRSTAQIELNPPTPGSSSSDYFVSVLEKFHGICVGELHEQSAPKRMLIENLGRLKAEGLSVLYLEHLCIDSMQPQIDAYLASNQVDLPEPLKSYLERLDSGHKVDDHEFGFLALVKAAKVAGIRIVATDTTLSYKVGGSMSTSRSVGDSGTNFPRYIAMNSTTTAIIEHDQKTHPGKYIALMGNGHIGTVTCKGQIGPPGVAELLKVPSIQIMKARDTPGIAVNQKDHAAGVNTISHIGAVISIS